MLTSLSLITLFALHAAEPVAPDCAAKLTSAGAISRHGGPQIHLWRLVEAGLRSEADDLEARLDGWMRGDELTRLVQAKRTRYRPWLVGVGGRFRAVWKANHEFGRPSVTRSPEAERATFLITRRLGLRLTPLNVPRTLDGVPGSLSLFVEDATTPPEYDLRGDAFFVQALIKHPDFVKGSLIRYGERDVLIDASEAFGPPEVFSWNPYAQALGFLEDRPRRAGGWSPLDLRRAWDARRNRAEITRWLREHLPTIEVLERVRAVGEDEWTELLAATLNAAERRSFRDQRAAVLRSIDAIRAHAGDGLFPTSALNARIGR